MTSPEPIQFAKQGYLIVPDLLTHDETHLLREIAHADAALQSEVLRRGDGEGGEARLTVINSLPKDTIYGAIVRSERIVRRMERFLGGEVYHYHHKMILKQPRTGGAWAWHQDYGYWYDNGCLFPYMASCMIAVDAADKENGCLQVLPGSHHLGRINHGPVGGDESQTGADAERMAHILERFEPEHVELQPGDAVFFHSNLLHRSDQNRSDRPRWAFICCYNAASNDPYKEHYHPRYTPLEVWSDSRVVITGQHQLSR